MSKYTFEDIDNGFSISFENKKILVILSGAELKVTREGSPVKTERRFSVSVYSPISLFAYRNLVKAVVGEIYKDYNPLDHKPKSAKPIPEYKITEWAHTQTARALGKRLCESWRRLLLKADPNIVAVHKAIFAATGTAARDHLIKDLSWYSNPYLVKDVVAYRAAAVALQYIDGFPSTRKMVLRPYLITNEADADDAYYAQYGRLTPANFHKLWMRKFSYNGELYTSLTKTLMNLPGNIPPSLLVQLASIKLDRPITDRLQLAVVLAWAEIKTNSTYIDGDVGQLPNNSANFRIIMNASREEIVRAAKSVGQHLRTNINLRKTGGITTFVRFLADYEFVHSGNIVGLAEKSIEQHKQFRQRRLQQFNRLDETPEYADDTAVALPPVPLPIDARIKFLSTVKEIREEGLTMGHCVGNRSYIVGAVAGNHYLFSFTHKDKSRATIQVSDAGVVIQSNGMDNIQNEASLSGKRILNRWAKSIRNLVSIAPKEEETPVEPVAVENPVEEPSPYRLEDKTFCDYSEILGYLQIATDKADTQEHVPNELAKILKGGLDLPAA